MAFPWKKLGPIFKAIYNAFLKGRKVGGVTLPSQGHGMGGPGTSDLDRTPHAPGPPDLTGGRR